MLPPVLTHSPSTEAKLARPVAASVSQLALNPAHRGPVLLATHGREGSDAPIRLALRVAERLGLDLHVVTVIEPMPIYGSTSDVASPPLPFEVEPHSVREDAVRRQLFRVIGDEDAFTLQVRYGPPVREIARAAAEIEATVVIVDAAPHRFLRHTVSGQRAAQVLRRLSCPVLSVAPDQAALPRRVLIATDFSPASTRAAHAALMLVEAGAQVTLAHVAPVFVFGQLLQDDARKPVPADVVRALDRLCDDLYRSAPAGVTIETRILTGGVVNALLAAADEMDADLIVAGTHGPNIVERFFIGSVATILLHVSQRSVLASPSPDPAEERKRRSITVLNQRPDEWASMLEAFTERNISRRVIVEVDDPSIGAQLQASGYLLQGTAYDAADGRVDIMLGAVVDGKTHLTRTIRNVTSVAISSMGERPDVALEVRHDQGHTLLVFDG